jgi:hypothetical protein
MRYPLFSILLWVWLAQGVSNAAANAAEQQEVLARFSFHDYLNRDWQNELVFFKLDSKLANRKDLVLLDPRRQPVSYQRSYENPAEIAFLASVPNFSDLEYTLVKGNPRVPAGLKANGLAETFEIANDQIAIRLNRGQKALEEGPIGGIRLTSGKWVGSGTLNLPNPPVKHELKVLEEGAIYADVESDYVLPDKGFWKLRFRIIVGEPIVLVDEQFSGSPKSSYQFASGAGLGPDHIVWRNEDAAADLPLENTGKNSVFVLEPWLEWWKTMNGNWLTAYRADGSDSLTVGLREPACWIEPGKTHWNTTVEVLKKNLELQFQLHGPERKWMFIALPKDAALKSVKDNAPLPQQYLIKYSDVPLDKIKNYVLDWPETNLLHPRLYISPEDLGAFRRDFVANPDVLDRLKGAVPNLGSLDDYVSYALATRDKKVVQKLAQFAVEQLQACVDLFVRQNIHPTEGYAPHKKYDKLLPTFNALDAILQPGVLEPEARARVRAQLAFLGYTLADPSFHSPERGYCANPNMTTSARCMSGIVACLISDHPQAKAWAQLGIGEMSNDLNNWTGPNGGWLEAPHYATVSLHALIGLALALRHTTFNDTNWSLHPKLKSAVRWLACISTPPDPRLDGQRRMPEIGNTYTGERTCLTGWMAHIWKEKDPIFAGEMQWMWKEQGSFSKPGIGGLYPALLGYSQLMFDPSIPARTPNWSSEWFPEAGAVLRAHFPGNQETYLHYIQGRLHQHYDYDEGSFILWGEGQPLCEDFGYYGRAPASDHNRMDYASNEALGFEGRISEFVPGEQLDYLHGERSGWHRQILFAKDKDPLGPNYFVIRDRLKSDLLDSLTGLLRPNRNSGVDWRVWIATDTVPGTDASAPIRVTGRFGVDLVVYFMETSGGSLSTEQISRTNGASGFTSRVTTQQSLHLQVNRNARIAAILYPVPHSQPTPTFTKLADGQAVKIESGYGTDYAFLSLAPFDFNQGKVNFHGERGLIQFRQDGAHLILSGPGKLGYKDRILANDKNTSETELIRN